MKIKIVNVCISFLFFLLLWQQVQSHLFYQLCQLEHINLFVGDSDWFLDSINKMGGAIEWIATWAIQFFDKPVGGVLMFLLPVAVMFAAAVGLFRNKNNQTGIGFQLAAVLAVVQLFSLYDFNFYWSGALALSLVMVLWWFLTIVKLPVVRNLLFIAIIPLITWWLGPVAFVYVLGGILLFTTRKNIVLTALFPLLIFGTGVYLLYEMGECPSWTAAVTPSLYYESMLITPSYHMMPWAMTLLIAAGSRFFPVVSFKNRIVVGIAQLLGWMVPVVVFILFGGDFRNNSNNDVWRLNHYAYNEDWDSILDFLKGKPMTNYLFMNYANMALAQKGELGDFVFHYSPRGANALLVNVNTGKDASVRMLASDIHYLVGCVGESQQQAFEAQVALPTSLGIQPLKRLVKTNLIFGHYAVAEKYLNLISKTTFHKEWAEKYRVFLYDDKAVEADNELGEKRRSLSKNNRFAMFHGWQIELEDILASNPQNKKAMTYLGISYLLNKDVKGFQRFLDKYYGTESLEILPSVFQQAVFVLFEQEKERWKDYDLSPQLLDRYSKFRELYLKNRKSLNLKNVMRNAYGNTFWYYLMFV